MQIYFSAALKRSGRGPGREAPGPLFAAKQAILPDLQPDIEGGRIGLA
jgi:hypothetical protein